MRARAPPPPGCALLTFVLVVVGLALVFDFVNGMNDAANSIATIVSTRVLSPLHAVLWAALFNFVAAFFLETRVADSISKLVTPGVVSVPMVLAALLGAVTWAHLCTRAGLPISISHSLIGGVIGAALAKTGGDVASLNQGKLMDVALFIVISPIAGMLGGFLLMVAVFWLFHKAEKRRVRAGFRFGQLISSAAFSFGHGASDAQKTMGIILLVIVSAGMHDPTAMTPRWVVYSAHAAIAAGTMYGGWRVIQTVGTRLTRLTPSGGFCAETAGAAVCLGTAAAGIPVSTTHTIVGAIMGVGSTTRVGAVRWEVASRIVWAWVLTLPCSGLMGAAAWWAVNALDLDALLKSP